MKRLLLFAALTIAATFGGLAVAQAQEGNPPRGWGGGPGSGMGPGMMGGGPEMMGGGPGMMGGGHMAVLAELPAEKREQVRKLHVATMQEMIAKRSFLPELELQLRNAMHAFPIDQAAAKKARADIARIREETFQLRLATMAQMQQIVGKETWEKMHRAGEPGAGHGPAMGPGAGMGPGR